MKTLALALAASILAACGGKVVVDDTTSVTQPTCADVCAKAATACGGTTQAQCEQSCAMLDPLLDGACPDAYHAWLGCIDDNPGAQCQNTSACATETGAVTSCLSMVCSANPSACIGM